LGVSLGEFIELLIWNELVEPMRQGGLKAVFFRQSGDIIRFLP
jgi:hypothetical protein